MLLCGTTACHTNKDKTVRHRHHLFGELDINELEPRFGIC